MIYPLCNKKPERAPRICGHTFILCWRCTGAVVGVIFMEILYLIYRPEALVLMPLAVFCVPIFIDVFKQYYLKILSTNPKRFITGFLCGVAIIGWSAIMTEWVKIYQQLL